MLFVITIKTHYFQVVFEFACGIDNSLADHLESLGVTVKGERLKLNDSSLQETKYDSDEDIAQSSDETSVLSDHKLNLDVTAMLAYVSNLTNGGCNMEFKEPILTQQAEWERKRPVKPILDQLFEGNMILEKYRKLL